MKIQSVDIDLYSMTGKVIFLDNSILNIKGTCQCETFYWTICTYMSEQFEIQTANRSVKVAEVPTFRTDD